MKQKVFLLLLALSCVAPIWADEISLSKEDGKNRPGTSPHEYPINNGGPRIPALRPVINADITDGVITTTIYRFSGTAYVYVCDKYGNIVANSDIKSNGSANHIMSLQWLEEGEYTIHYVVNGFQFVGEFSI